MGAALVADIGGSKSRFALASSAGWPEHIRVIENDSMPDLESAVASYLAETAAQPKTATLAIAGPIQGEEIALTNRNWRFRRAEFARRFGFSRLRIVNDFEAVAWALPYLADTHVRALGPSAVQSKGVKVVLGPGTGLGVAALIPSNGCWNVVASEGGHVSFGACEQDEIEVFARLRQQSGPVSAETVLSGPGLVRLARALDLATGYEHPEAIIAGAHRDEPKARRVTEMFVRLLGRFAGDLALTFKAVGGVYVAGGVGFALGALLDAPAFRAAFEAHAPYQSLLQAIATLLITCEQPGLVGCAVLAQIEEATAPMPA